MSWAGSALRPAARPDLRAPGARGRLPVAPELVVRAQRGAAEGASQADASAEGRRVDQGQRAHMDVSANNAPDSCVVGIDFGTLSGRALVVRVA